MEKTTLQNNSKSTNKYLAVGLLGCLLVICNARCGTQTDSEIIPSDSTMPSADGGIIPDPGKLEQKVKISECGGFQNSLFQDSNSDTGPAPRKYCDAEVLAWEYDETTGIIRFSNNRVLLNCCGERSIQTAMVDKHVRV